MYPGDAAATARFKAGRRRSPDSGGTGPDGLHCRAAIRRLTFAASLSTAVWNPLQSSSPVWPQRRNSARSLGHLRKRPRSDEPGREGSSRHNPNQVSHNVLLLP